MSFTTELPNIFPDFITSRNLLLFIISKEYLDYVAQYQNNCMINDIFDEDAKCHFYTFLFKSVKDDSVDIFNVIKDENNVLKKKLTMKVVERISRLVVDVNELITYSHTLELINSIMSPLHDREDVVDADRTGTVCKYSVMGVFMKKFALAFNCLSMEKVLYFMKGFKQVVRHYGIIENDGFKQTSESSRKISAKYVELKCERLCEDQVLSSLENIYKNANNILFEPSSNTDSIKSLRPTLNKYKKMYPDISDTSFLDHLLTIKNKNLETFEKDIQHNFPAKFLSKQDDTSKSHIKSQEIANKDGKKTSRAINLFSYHKKMSEINLNSAATLLSMGFKNEALLHFKNALFNAKLSKNTDLLDEVRNVGNSLMPINDNPNPTVFSKNSDTLSDKAALGNIRISMLHYLHNSPSSLAELLHLYFTSVAPQRRDISPICVIYLSIIFRSFGFELVYWCNNAMCTFSRCRRSMANTYIIIATCLESLRRTQNHEHVIVEVFAHLIQNFTSSGHFDKAMRLFKSLKSLGGGILADNNQIQSSMLQCCFNNSVTRLDYAKAQICIEKLKNFAIAECAIRRVQLLFMEDNNVAADRLGNHLISFAIKKRDLFVYNHVSISTGRPTISSTITDHRTSGIIENSLEASVTKEFPSLDDIGTQNWGSRDWALYECRCRWLMCYQLINRRQLKTAENHLDSLKNLAQKFSFFHFLRLAQLLQLALDSCQHESDSVFSSPLSLATNKEKAQSILSSRMALSYKNQMIFSNLVLKLYISGATVSRDTVLESELERLGEYYERCYDYMGQAHCWQMRVKWSTRCGDEKAKNTATHRLDMLLENRFVNVHNLDFLSNVL